MSITPAERKLDELCEPEVMNLKVTGAKSPLDIYLNSHPKKHLEVSFEGDDEEFIVKVNQKEGLSFTSKEYFNGMIPVCYTILFSHFGTENPIELVTSCDADYINEKFSSSVMDIEKIDDLTWKVSMNDNVDTVTNSLKKYIPLCAKACASSETMFAFDYVKGTVNITYQRKGSRTSIFESEEDRKHIATSDGWGHSHPNHSFFSEGDLSYIKRVRPDKDSLLFIGEGKGFIYKAETKKIHSCILNAD